MLKSAIGTLFTRCVVTVILLAQSVLWTRLLAPEGRGIYAKLQTSQNFLVLFLGFGLTSGLVYFGASRRMTLARLWSLSIYTALFSSLILTILIAAMVIWPSTDIILADGHRSWFFVFYLLISFLLTQFQLPMNALIASEKRYAELNYIELASSLFRLALFVIAFVNRDSLPSLRFLFALDLLAHVAKTLAYSFFFRRLDFKVDWRPPLMAEIKPILKYSFLLYTLYIVQFLYQRVDVWIIEKYASLAALGIFASALGLAQYMTVITIALNNVMHPSLSGIDDREALHSFSRFARLNGTILAAPLLVFALFPETLLTLLFGRDFSGGAFTLRVLGIGYWFHCSKHLFIYFNASRERLRANLKIESFGLLVGVILNLVLIPRYGIDGAAISFLILSVSTWAVSYLSIRRQAGSGSANYVLLTPSEIRDGVFKLKNWMSSR